MSALSDGLLLSRALVYENVFLSLFIFCAAKMKHYSWKEWLTAINDRRSAISRAGRGGVDTRGPPLEEASLLLNVGFNCLSVCLPQGMRRSPVSYRSLKRTSCVLHALSERDRLSDGKAKP